MVSATDENTLPTYVSPDDIVGLYRCIWSDGYATISTFKVLTFEEMQEMYYEGWNLTYFG